MLLLGAGGLGAPTALYLAAAGIGTLGIVDDDVVDASNLQRQVIHNTERIGEPKTESARKTIEALNPDVKVVEHNDPARRRATSSRSSSDYDVIVDGADNFPTRYLLNDASVRLRKPVVSASILALRRARSRPSSPSRAPATAASTRLRRRPSWRRAAAPTACSA